MIEKVIERLNEKTFTAELYDNDKWNGQTVNNLICLGDVKEVLEEIAAEYNNSWIPCSERLPEEPFGCLVTVMDCEPSTQTDYENILPYHVGYDGETWNDADGEVIPFEVIAWMPLPQPYKVE